MKTMLSRVLAVAVAVGAVAVPQVVHAADGPVQMPGTSHWYQWFESPVYYWEAVRRANAMSFQGMEGHLVTVTSQAENDFLRQQDGRNWWLALQDIGPRDGGVRRWAWADGPESGTVVTSCGLWQMSDSCVSDSKIFANWSSSEPNNAYGRESAAVNNWNGGGWNDVGPSDNGSGFGFIVEFEPDWKPSRVSGQVSVFAQTGPSARGMDVLADGTIFVARGGTGASVQSGTVWQIDSGGKVLKEFTGPGSAHSVVQLPDGSLIAAQWADSALTRFNIDGTSLRIPLGDISYDVDLLPDGNFLVTGGNAAWIRVYSPDGSLVRSISEKACALYSAVDQTGAIYFMSSMTWTSGCIPFGLYRWSEDSGLTRLPSNLPPAQYEGIAIDMAQRVYLSDNSRHQVVVVEPSGDTYPLAQFQSGTYALAMRPDGDLLLTAPEGMYRVALTGGAKPALRPGQMTAPTVVAGNGTLTVSWSSIKADGNAPRLRYVAAASPGGTTCNAAPPETTCTLTNLSRAQSYTVTVRAINALGSGPVSAPSAAAYPMLVGFQTWVDDVVLAVGVTTNLSVAQAQPNTSVAISGGIKANLMTDNAGYATTVFTSVKAGIQKFTATYSVKVGKKTTKYTATTQLYVPSLSGPMLKIKQGKTGKFSLQFMPPGAAVAIALSDGRTLTSTADSTGKASFTPTFNTLGAVTYAASVAGVPVGTGGLTVTK